MFLLGKNYEECKSCQTLKEQLIFEREEKKRLEEVLISIVQPKPSVVETQQPVLTNPIPGMTMFSRKKAILEARDREEARILEEHKHLGKPDEPTDAIKLVKPVAGLKTIDELEQELGVNEEVQKEG